MSDEPLPADFTHMPCGGWCVGECPGCCACGNTGCSGCQHGDEVDQPATGGVASDTKPVGEEGCTLYVPLRPDAADRHVTLEFDTSPETLRRIKDALRRFVDQP